MGRQKQRSWGQSIRGQKSTTPGGPKKGGGMSLGKPPWKKRIRQSSEELQVHGVQRYTTLGGEAAAVTQGQPRNWSWKRSPGF